MYIWPFCAKHFVNSNTLSFAVLFYFHRFLCWFSFFLFTNESKTDIPIPSFLCQKLNDNYRTLNCQHHYSTSHNVHRLHVKFILISNRNSCCQNLSLSLHSLSLSSFSLSLTLSLSHPLILSLPLLSVSYSLSLSLFLSLSLSLTLFQQLIESWHLIISLLYWWCVN